MDKYPKMYTIFSLKRDMANDTQLVLGKEHWGKCAWSFIYNVVLSYKGDVTHLRKFLKNLRYVLPCEECKSHYAVFLKNNKIPKELYKIFQWCERLENKIAKIKYKKEFVPISRLAQILTPRDTSDTSDTSSVDEETSVAIKRPDCVNCNKDRLAKSLRSVSMLNMGAAMPYNYEVPLGYSRKI